MRLAAIVIAVGVASPLDAQHIAIPLQIDHVFDAGRADTSTVRLDLGRAYRAELLGSGELVVSHERLRARPALLVLDSSQSRPGHSVFELYARERGNHQVSVAHQQMGTSSRVLIGIDSQGTEAMTSRTSGSIRRSWRVGIRAAAGAQSAVPLNLRDSAGGGRVLDGALRIASAAFPLSITLGGAFQDAERDDPSVTWFYLEPQVRLLRTGGLEVGATGMLSQGNVSQLTIDPTYLGAGGFLTYSPTRDPARRGLAAQVRYTYGSVKNTNADDSPMHVAIAGLVWTF